MSTAARASRFGPAARELFFGFVRRDLAGRYQGALLGALWAFGQPVLMLLIYGFVFSQVFRVKLPDLAPNTFLAFIACALWPWLAFQEAVQRATQAVSSNADLVRKVAFPAQLLVLASVSASFCLHALGFAVVMLLLWLGGEPFRAAGLLLLPLAWLLLYVLACGITLATSALQVVLKDVDHVLGPLFMLLFYVTPILYPLALVPETMRRWMLLNPFLHVFEPLRAGLLGGRWNAALEMLPLAAAAVLIGAFGAWVFARMAPHFEDFL